MTDPDKQEKVCRGCGKPMTAYGGEETGRENESYCPQCLIEQAERHIKEGSLATSKLNRWRDTKAWKVSMSFIILLCLGILAYQVPRLTAAFSEPKPVRMGTYATDAAADKCINNLWRLARNLQQGRDLDKNIVCPVSGKPYKLIPGLNPEIHCPNPEAHGFTDMAVSKNYPVPELKKKR